MLIEIIAISFIIAFLRGGKVATIKFNKPGFLASGIILQIAANFNFYSGFLMSVAYLCVILFFYANREHEDFRIFMIGWLLNALAIWSNKGKMPIDMTLAERLPFSTEKLIAGTDFKHVVLTDASNLPFLSDVIYMPFIIPRVISIGDIFIMLGAFLLVQRLLNKPISLMKLREGKNYAIKN